MTRCFFLQITLYPMVVSVPLFLICGYLWDDGMICSLDIPVLAALLYRTYNECDRNTLAHMEMKDYQENNPSQHEAFFQPTGSAGLNNRVQT